MDMRKHMSNKKFNSLIDELLKALEGIKYQMFVSTQPSEGACEAASSKQDCSQRCRRAKSPSRS